MIKWIFYNDMGGWHEDPIYMLSNIVDSNSNPIGVTISVAINRDKVFVSGIYDKTDMADDLLKLMEDLEAMPHEERINMLNARHALKKFNL